MGTERHRLARSDQHTLFGPGQPAPPTTQDSGNLYFMLKPSEDVRSLVHAMTSRHCRLHGGGRCMPYPEERLHVTALHLADVEPPRWLVERASLAASAIRARPIRFRFDRTAFFANGKCLVLVEACANAEFQEFARALKRAVRLANVPAKPGIPLAAHMTTIYERKGTPLMAVDSPIEWTADEFALIYSHRGHKEYGAWPLDAEAPPYPRRPFQLEMNLDG